MSFSTISVTSRLSVYYNDVHGHVSHKRYTDIKYLLNTFIRNCQLPIIISNKARIISTNVCCWTRFQTHDPTIAMHRNLILC